MNGNACVNKSEPEFESIIKSFSLALDRYNDLNNRVEQAVVKLKEFRDPSPEANEKPTELIGVIQTLNSMLTVMHRMNDRLERTIIGLNECV